MLRLAADENFNSRIVRGLLHRKPDLDIEHAFRILVCLEQMTKQCLNGQRNRIRILLTHDVRTITQYAYERVDADQLMPGVFEVSPDMSIGRAIEDIVVAGGFSLEGEW